MAALGRTTLCEMLDVTVPIIQAPMGGICTPELVAAVCNAGGLGLHPMSWATPEEIRHLVERTRAQTNRPFGANLVLYWDQQERLDVLLEAGVRIISFFWGDPADYLAKTKAAGAITLMTVGNADEARRAVDLGIDIVVAQGYEAGGHVWGEVTTMALVPAVVDAVSPVPVVAAGGIADGRGMAAALALGASGVWMGTRFINSPESDAHDWYRDRLLEAKETDTVHNALFDEDWQDATLRCLANSTWRNWLAAGRPPRDQRPGAGEILARRRNGEPVIRYFGNALSTDIAGDFEAMAIYAGQCVGLVHDIKPAGEIVREVAEGAAQILARLGTQTSAR